MKIEIEIPDDEVNYLQLLLRRRYNTKTALLSTLTKKALREVGYLQAKRHLTPASPDRQGRCLK